MYANHGQESNEVPDENWLERAEQTIGDGLWALSS